MIQHLKNWTSTRCWCWKKAMGAIAADALVRLRQRLKETRRHDQAQKHDRRPDQDRSERPLCWK
jgi:hypothetical protein